MHFLDLIMYFVCYGFIWFLLDLFSGGELTNELGGFIGLLIMFIYTIIYIILFVFVDYNWIDIFHSMSLNVKW